MSEHQNNLELLERCLEETASPEEEQQIIEAAEGFEEFRQAVLKTAEMDALLYGINNDEDEFSIQVVKRIMNKGQSGPFAKVIREKIEKEQIKPVERASERLRAMRGQRKSLVKHFAAAAVLVLAIGALAVYFAFIRIPEDMLTLSSITGTVTIERDGKRIPAVHGINLMSGDAVITSKDSLCRVDSKDGSIIALNENTNLTFSFDRHGLTSLTYKKGQVFADIPEPTKDLSITLGNATLTVLGTEFQIRTSYEQKYTTIDVFKGSVKFQQGTLGGYITEGHSGFLVQTDLGNRDTTRKMKDILYIMVPPRAIPVEWLNNVNISIQDLLSAYAAHKKTSLIDFDNYLVRSGIWKIEQKENDTVITQEIADPDVRADILIGKPEWKKGTVSVDIKIKKYAPGESKIRAALSFFYESGKLSKASFDSFGLSKQLALLREQGYTGWINLKIDFKVIEAEDAIEMQMFFDPLPKGIAEGSYYKFRKDNTNSTYIFERETAGVGLSCSGVSAEFRNFKVIPR
ncbi:FecR domain-containing protein [Planctomycetota bacterium]